MWDKRNPKGDSGGVSSQHELILVFARDRATLLGGDSRGLRRHKNSAQEILDMATRIWASVGESTDAEHQPADCGVAVHRGRQRTELAARIISFDDG